MSAEEHPGLHPIPWAAVELAEAAVRNHRLGEGVGRNINGPTRGGRENRNYAMRAGDSQQSDGLDPAQPRLINSFRDTAGRRGA